MRKQSFPILVGENRIDFTNVDNLEASRVLWLIGNADRCRALFQIADNDGLTVSELNECIPVHRTTIYQHVNRLRNGGWIRQVRRGRKKVLVCAGPQVHQIVAALRGMVNDLPYRLRFASEALQACATPESAPCR